MTKLEIVFEQRYDFEPLADKMTPLNQREARSIPRPGSSVKYVEGTQLTQVSPRLPLILVSKPFDNRGAG